MKAGRVYKKFRAKNGKTVTLRALKWEDLDGLVVLINRIVEERDTNSDLGILADTKKTRDEEARWLSQQLIGIESGEIVSVVADVDGRPVANGDVRRGGVGDIRHHGYLGIIASREYRGLGIGTEMMKTLLRESRKAGLRNIELEVFENNPGAIHLYEKVGFKQVGRIPRKIHRGRRFFDGITMSVEL